MVMRPSAGSGEGELECKHRLRLRAPRRGEVAVEAESPAAERGATERDASSVHVTTTSGGRITGVVRIVEHGAYEESHHHLGVGEALAVLSLHGALRAGYELAA